MNINKRKRDYFHAYLVRGAAFDGVYDLPLIENLATEPPNELLLFSKMSKAKNANQWVHFYTEDRRFENLWKEPSKYVERLKQFNGIISPDFSVYFDMPLPLQLKNIYRNRALAYWLGKHGVPVIPNVRWGRKNTYDFCFAGLPSNSMLAVGTCGCIQSKQDFLYFQKGLEEMMKRLYPHTLVVYGPAPTELFGKYEQSGIRIVRFATETERVYKKEVA